ncbi:MAG: HNH endonuclease [Pseudomonadota bacterium]
MPLSWLTKQEAVTLLVKDRVLWSLGDGFLEIRGGYSSDGTRTILELPTILACEGQLFQRFHAPPVSNWLLFRRDQNVCLYCGNHFKDSDLSRDHITPKSHGGQDRWSNLATACRRCNQRKGNRTPEDAKMPLIAVPFAPNLMEYLALANRNILTDQMDFLKAGFSRNMRVQ